MRVRLQIAYDGTDYAGWQKQGESTPDPRPTLQATLESALAKIFSADIRVQASGRTDAGVHAEAQTVHFDVPVDAAGTPLKDVASMKLVRSLNALTPSSLAVQKAWMAPAEFHALHSAVQKTYRYVIHNASTPNPLGARYALWFPKPLDIQKLNGLVEVLVGEHDFKSFQTAGTELKTTVRQLYEARWTQPAPETLELRLTGSGFLKQMVRNIVGTTLYLHQNGFGPEEMKKILVACDRQTAKTTARPHGLFLESVIYPPHLDSLCTPL